MNYKILTLVFSYLLFQLHAKAEDKVVNERLDLMVEYGILTAKDAEQSKVELKRLSNEDKDKINTIFRTISSIEEAPKETSEAEKP